MAGRCLAASDDIFNHPYVKRLEAEVVKYQGEWINQIAVTQKIQTDHATALAHLHEVTMIGASKNFAEFSLEMARGDVARTPVDDDDGDVEPKINDAQ